ncbi:MAG TPA: helix-turn-helix domain-containing GNAT family N-acetyltransferase [Xanthobacteraceae bacterium]|nr:helix-turn-helix domain-containing GNAT family N-acetyltransferase [Xanthobacteraceae bacterium]
MAGQSLDAPVAAVRRFNRFYTRRIGVVTDRMLGSPFSLTEARVLYELAHRDRPTAGEIGATLGLDAGYLSRMLKDFARRGLVTRTRSARDGRARHLVLTAAGRRAFAPLERGSQRAVAEMLRPLRDDGRRELLAALSTVERLLADAAPPAPITVRRHRPGDIGWIIGTHARVYAEEYGWDASFEALMVKIMTPFLRQHDRAREACWIAELDGEPVGCVALVRQSDRVAKLRVFLVTRAARGRGVGKALIAECLRFARAAGYRKVVLWTQKGLDAARHLYEAAGFKLVREEPHHSWGKDHIGQYWALRL